MALWFSHYPDSGSLELYEWCEEALLPPAATKKETLSQVLTVVFFPQYTGRSEQCSSVYCPRAVITCVNRRNNNPSQKHREEMKYSQLSWTDSETELGASEQDHTKGDSSSLLLFKTWAVKTQQMETETSILLQTWQEELSWHSTLLSQEPGPLWSILTWLHGNS